MDIRKKFSTVSIMKIQRDCGIVETFKILLYKVMADFTKSLDC